MTKTLNSILFVLLVVVFIVKLVLLIADQSQNFRMYVNASMFLLIGLTYIVRGFEYDKLLKKVIYLLCGVTIVIWLIYNSFKPEFNFITLFALLIPLLLDKIPNKLK